MTTALVPGVWDQRASLVTPSSRPWQRHRTTGRNTGSLKSGLRVGTQLLLSLPRTKARRGQAQVGAPGRYRPAVISRGQTGWLRTRDTCSVTVLEMEVLDQGVSQAGLPLKGLKKL